MAASATSMAQLNVRMDPELKAAGDQVLSLVGVTPVQVVRAVWKKIAQGPKAYQDLVDELARDSSQDGETSADLAVQQGSLKAWADSRWQQLAAECGVSLSSHKACTDDELDELAYQDYLDRERERSVYYA